jgi:uncharacterized delta-60 repeat protein
MYITRRFLRLIIVCFINLSGFLAFSQSSPLDISFGTHGSTIFNVTSNFDTHNNIAVQSDNKIILATAKVSWETGMNYDFCLIRYNSNGTIDSTFGNGGMVQTELGSIEDFAYNVVIQPDDKIIVVGTTGTYVDRDFAVVRYNPDGTLDADFGNNGIVKKNSLYYDDILYTVAIQSDGKIIAGGVGNTKAYLIRLESNGTMDDSFGNLGIVNFSLAEYTLVYDIHILESGKIMVAGQLGGSGAHGFVARLNNNGSIDNTFGTNGSYIIHFVIPEFINTIFVQNDGKILVGGCRGYMIGSYPTTDFLVLRLLENGTLDNSFNDLGVLTINFDNKAENCNKILTDNDGNIFAVGYSDNLQLPKSDFAVAKILPNGTLDASFGIEGKIITDFGSSNDKIQGALIDATNRLVVSGIWGDSSNAIICRYKTSIFDKIEKPIEKNKIIQIYPNPCRDYTKIECLTPSVIIEEILICDYAGKKVYQQKISGTSINSGIKIDTHFLVPGIYTLQIKTDKEIFTEKLIKN